MRIKRLALSFSLTVMSALHAQQTMPDMPGMQMGKPQAKPRAEPMTPSPFDLTDIGRDAGDARARAAAQSVQQSFQQQAGQTSEKPASGSDASSTKIPFQDLQEPEAIGFHTGSELTAPELLREVMAREPITLESFLQLAKRSNPTLSQAQRNVERSLQQARQMGLPPDPIAGYSGDHIRGGEYHGGEQGVFFSQDIVLGRKLALRREVLKTEACANEQGVEIQRARLRNDVGRAFYDALAAQQAVVVRDRLLKTSLDAETNAHELERIGVADASAVLTAEVAAEQAKIDFVEAQRMFLASFALLATYSGQGSLPPRPLSGNLMDVPELKVESLVEEGRQHSPLVQQASANVSVAEARLKSAKREPVPDLSIKAGEWNSGEQLSSTTRRAGFESFAEAGLRIPLWNRNHGNIEASRVQLERSHEDMTRLQLVTKNRLEHYSQTYQSARFTAERYRTEILPRARRSYQLQVLQYQQMAQPYPPVLVAQRMLFTLQLTYIRALNEEWEAAIALQNFALTGALEEPISIGMDDTTRNLPNSGGEN